MRAAQSQAGSAATNAGNLASQYGSQGDAAYSQLMPFLTRELNSPGGYSPQDLTSMLAAAEGGAGGATSGITGQANLEAARTGQTGGFQTALDAAARSRQQAAASTSENIAGQNAQLKQQQQQSAATGLNGLFGANNSAMFNALGLQNQDLNTQVKAGQSGWLQNALGIANTITGGGQAAGSILRGMNG